MLEIYVDGSVKNNGKENSYGSWGYVVVYKDEKVYEESGKVQETTNNRMEMTASINAIKYILSNRLEEEIKIYSDSQYVVNGITTWSKNWEKRNWEKTEGGKKVKILNHDLWKEFKGLYETTSTTSFEWIKGHNGNKWNVYVDKLCTSAYNEAPTIIPKEVRKRISKGIKAASKAYHESDEYKITEFIFKNEEKYKELVQFIIKLKEDKLKKYTS